MPRLTVANLNAHWTLDPARLVTYDLEAAVRGLDADVVALEETWRPRGGPAQHVAVAEALGYELHEMVLPRRHNRRVPEPIRRTDGHRSLWGVAILSRAPATARRELALPPVALDDADRRALVVDLDVGGVAVTVVATHLTYRPWGSRSHLRRLASVLPGPDRAGVVLGDLNMWGPVVEAALPGWRRAVRGRTWPVPRPHSQIDHVLVNRGVSVVEGRVLAPVGSDHLPVRAVLDLSDADRAPDHRPRADAGDAADVAS